jgi:hypothetical protein
MSTQSLGKCHDKKSLYCALQTTELTQESGYKGRLKGQYLQHLQIVKDQSIVLKILYFIDLSIASHILALAVPTRALQLGQ